jgi:probable O-glycosylation ligase (exosortase A-associated)
MALRYPVYGMMAYIGYSLVAPHALTFGMAMSFPHVALIAGCTILGFLFWSESRQLPRQREVTLLIVVWGLFGVSTIFAIEPEFALEKFGHVSKIMFMTVLSLFLINSRERLHLLFKVIALALGFHAFKIGLFVIRTGAQSTVYGPDASFLEANNSMGMALAMNAPLLFYLAKVEENAWVRRIMLFMLVMTYPAVIGTFSRGAWVALGVASGLLVVRSQRKGSLALVVVILAALSPVWLPVVGEKLVSDKMVERYGLLQNYEEDDSAQSRFWNWTFCAKVAFAHPIEGGGFDYYSLDAYARYYPEFLVKYPGKVWSCHNMWLTILGEHGVVTFLVWVGLLASCLLSNLRIRAFALARGDIPAVLQYTYMLEGALVAYMIAGSFLDIAYFEVYYMLVMAVIVLKTQIANESISLSSRPGKDGLPASVNSPKEPAIIGIREF